MKMKDLLSKKLWRPASINRRFKELKQEVESSKLLTARLLVQNLRQSGLLPRISDAEFRVFSQFGDDGIIQYLINHIQPRYRTFVEFGVENYTEANTKFLLQNDNWSGLVMDGSVESMQGLRKDPIYWRHELTAVGAFIDRDNINDLISNNGFRGEIGLLSVDIDGNDYWVWEHIHCVNPTIVIAEYNAVFGDKDAVSIPYNPKFVRNQAHSSLLYWGCSLGALVHLANLKGYAFVGCNSNGNNSYFIRRDQLGKLQELTTEQGFVDSKFREARDLDGRLSFVSGPDRRKLIADMPVIDVTTGRSVKIADLSK
jgi:hypothetical protein